VEETYDGFLRGAPGLTRVQVDAFGQPTPGGTLVNQPPTAGDNLKLTIDGKVQAAGESALGSWGLPGAFVTMDVHSGEILALGSAPAYDPTIFTKPLTQRQVDQLYRDPVLAPLTDRVTEGSYPTGSTYKLVTALAALEAGKITPEETIEDGGSITVAEQEFENAGGEAHGSVDLYKSLQVSSDVYYYLLGLKMWDTGELQGWSGRLGIGGPTGIDLPGDPEGLVPSEKWRNDLFAAGETERPWSAGDNIQLAIGQGDLQTSPLQLAIAYATLGNGGTVMTPHVGLEIEDAAGRVLKELEFEPKRRVKIDPRHRAEILDGLHAAAQVPGGTSYDTFGAFPVKIAGKTGTAERPPNGDMAWYAALAPYPNPRIVTVVGIEDGGFGAETAAPTALKILEAYFGKQAGESAEEAGAEAAEAGVGVE
jgi:penicillin-binding protein 2